MAFIPGGTFLMGSDRHYPEEAPAHRVAVDDFWIDRDPVTNAEFERFVRASGYVTLAERPLDSAQHARVALHLLQPASLVFSPPSEPVEPNDWRLWWRLVPGASWRRPYGPGSSCKGLEGGSHLCAPSYCRRYRPAARQAQTIDSPTSHIGFRCIARDAPPAWRC